MDQNLIVISQSEEIRKAFLDSYSLLGYEVKVTEDILEVIRELNYLEPDQVILDVDGLARKWKILAAGLRGAQKKITLILLVSSMNLEQANEALMLGVSGIIVKPFLREFHLKRVYNIIHRKLRAEGKRIYPRFYAGTVFDGALTVRSPTTGQLHVFELINVSEIGVAVRTRDLAVAPELQRGAMLEDALLRIDNQEFLVSAQVAFRQQGLLGIGFQRIKKGKANFLRFIQKLSLKAFGISGIKGKW
jgi:DNA-binding response OmpR family regulator